MTRSGGHGAISRQLLHNSLRESVILQHVRSLNIFKIASKVGRVHLFSKSSAIHTLTNVRTTKQPKGAGSWQHTHVPAVILFLELNKTNKSSSHEKRCLPLELNPDKVPQQSFVPEQMFFITAPPLKFKDSKSLNIQAPSENSSQPHFRASSDGASCHHMCTFTWTGRRTDQPPLLVNSETASGLKGLFHARIVQHFLGFVYFQAAVFLLHLFLSFSGWIVCWHAVMPLQRPAPGLACKQTETCRPEVGCQASLKKPERLRKPSLAALASLVWKPKTKEP